MVEPCNDSMSLAVRKLFLRLNGVSEYNRTSNVFVDVNFGVKNHNFKFSPILDKYNIMIVTQKLKMQEFTSAINVECLHSSLRAKLLLHNCTRKKYKKHVFVACKVI